MPRILLVAKMAKNGRRRQDHHPNVVSVPVFDKRTEIKKQKSADKKSRIRERAMKYANDAMSHETPDRPASSKFDTYILHLKAHVLDVRREQFTARL
jgi:hypothetical protein